MVTKKFSRFREIRQGDSWYVGRDRWDAIIFQPNLNVKIYGIGVYEPTPTIPTFTLGFKFHIEESDGTNIQSSEIIEEEISTNPNQEDDAVEIRDHVVWYKFSNFPNGIVV